MPPRPRRRPAAEGRHRGDRDRGEADREAGREGALRRRPAAAEERVTGFEAGEEVAAHQIPVGVWKPGLRLLGMGAYYNREISVAVEVDALRFQGGALEVMTWVTGAEDEGLLRWATGNAGTPLRCHVCLEGCGNIPEGDDVLHLKKVKYRGVDSPGWVDNLKEPTGMEELRRLAARSDALARGVEEVKDPGKEMKEAPIPAGQDTKSSSRSSGGRKKKKKKSFKPMGKKDYSALYKGTGLDQDARIRKKVSRLARRAMKKKSKSSSSSGTSSTSEAAEGLEDLFQESQRTQLASRAGPGALAYHAIRQMRKQMLQEQGQEGLEVNPVGAVGLQFYRQILRRKMTPVMAREAFNIGRTAELPAGSCSRRPGPETQGAGMHGGRLLVADVSTLRDRAHGLGKLGISGGGNGRSEREQRGAEEPPAPKGRLGSQLLERRQGRPDFAKLEKLSVLTGVFVNTPLVPSLRARFWPRSCWQNRRR